MRNISTLLQPCSVETLLYVKGYYSIGMYNLRESDRCRYGQISIREVNGDEVDLLLIESGVLDMKINANILGCALSDSSLGFVSLDENAKIKSLYKSQCDSTDGLYLSLSWNSKINGIKSMEGKVATSTQNGSVILFNVHTSNCSSSDSFYVLECDRIPNKHKLNGEEVPAWITVFDPHSGHCSSTDDVIEYSDSNVLLSGGDDGVFNIWDLRCRHDYNSQQAQRHFSSAFNSYDVSKCDKELTEFFIERREECESGRDLEDCYPVARSKYHTCGVTSAAYHPTRQYILATGSYDESVCIWDTRNLKQPLSTVATGGGVWRTKWRLAKKRELFSTQDQLLLSCMYAGSFVYEVGDSYALNMAHEVLPTVQDPDHNGISHLAYGIDIVEDVIGMQSVLATCSFYEKTVTESLIN